MQVMTEFIGSLVLIGSFLPVQLGAQTLRDRLVDLPAGTRVWLSAPMVLEGTSLPIRFLPEDAEKRPWWRNPAIGAGVGVLAGLAIGAAVGFIVNLLTPDS